MSARFEVWAPAAVRVDVEAGGARYAMEARPSGSGSSGWWEAEVADASHGTGYGFVLDGADEVLPDPRSPWQPDGVHGQSRVYDHGRFAWTDQQWHGRPLAGSVLYEMHVGTFTAEGTFDAAIERLDHLVALGIDAVELLPVASFPGRHGWGYDGVHLWAPHEPYGGPDGLKRFVDAAHSRGLAVVLDVVYNHLGPDGNRLGSYGPYFTSAHATPWGDAVNFDQEGSDEVRAFVVQNALMWLRDYHLDGLRLDAVHAITDHGAEHLLEEMGRAVSALSAHLGRELFLIAESDLNDPRLVTSREAGGYGLDAQWSDDFHHALHAALTGERQGYYCDFGSLETLKKAFTKAFVHDGTMSTYRGRHHGRPVNVGETPAHRFLGFLQNHDQVGNRAAGDRIGALLPSPGLLKVGAALLLLAPFTPMLFMGEEWGAATPWCYFTDHQDPELARAVSEGRRREFSRHGWSGEVPDPQAVDTFRRSVLDWAEPDRPPHADLLAWHRDLIALRRSRPELNDPRLTATAVETCEETGDQADDVAARWLTVRRGSVCVAANLGDRPVLVPVPGRGEAAPGLLLASDPAIRLDPVGLGDSGTASVVLPGASVAVLDLAGPPALRG
ncbi:malto-oligosyltrehalose trehalohydrolase [Actinomadura luteofluorescens]|uniref:malto-oligosyltrehalose trehalohydrolase n=1 Tax=Actinomadura luteofluorescens TaxID=46163 RepID=UPI0021642468|nr:malto-oligosyltrehalose trehalohydrolase [Actinomadura glauciflava]MCR3743774.1 maltooligosyl trehalose hydrolase (EC 3.2.1.141) [Actinomadura glauciflava]